MSAEGVTTRSVVIERELPHPAEKVWRALTEGALIKEWLLDNNFKPVVGHRFQFRATPVGGWSGVVESEVLVVEPITRLSYRWESMGLETVVVWTLRPNGKGTLLRMEQTGFRDDQDMAYKGATYGWKNFIGKLEGVVAELT
jgi:uncharacterized protein YndB with AHSA1/START domain